MLKKWKVSISSGMLSFGKNEKWMKEWRKMKSAEKEKKVSNQKY